MIDRHSIYKPENTMRELIRDNNLLLMTISRFDIAFGFGDNSVRETCDCNRVDVETFLAVCNLLSGKEHESYPVSLPSLIEYLKRAHSSFIDISLPRIRHRIIEAINSSETNEVSFLLIKFFDDYVAEVRQHLEHENEVVFKYVEKLLSGEKDESYRISRFSVDHDHMGQQLNELKDIFIYHQNIDDKVDALGEREKEIICCVAKGMSNKEIAEALCLSVHTVATHRKNISAKLEIHSTAGLAIFAILHKLVDLKDLNPHSSK